MLKRLLVAAIVLILAVGIGLYFYAQAIFASDLVRTQVAAQLSSALGQPVSIGTIGARIVPRVAVALGEVRIGDPARITIERIDMATALGALLTRRIDRATAHVSGVRIELPLPAFAPDQGSTAAGDAPAVSITSIDEVVLRDVELVSGGRTLRGDVEVVPHGAGMTIRRLSLGAGDARIEVTGEIASMAGPVGELAVQAGTLDLFELLAFAGDFARGAQAGGGPASAPAPSPSAPMNLTASIAADRAVMGTLLLDALEGQARLTDDWLALDPIAFRVFGGGYAGSLGMGLGESQEFRLRATLDAIDMAAFSAFAGMPDIITGRLVGTLDVAGRGLSPAEITSSVQGRARADITQGSIKGLGLVRAVVVATSMRADADRSAPVAAGAEPFSRLGVSLAIGEGLARTTDLRFESDDVLMSARGYVALDGGTIDLAGPLQLSDDLSKQAGRDLVRYTQQDGRVTIPARVTGSAENPLVTIDVSDLLQRAITNKAVEEAGKAIERGLGGLLNRGSTR